MEGLSEYAELRGATTALLHDVGCCVANLLDAPAASEHAGAAVSIDETLSSFFNAYYELRSRHESASLSVAILALTKSGRGAVSGAERPPDPGGVQDRASARRAGPHYPMACSLSQAGPAHAGSPAAHVLGSGSLARAQAAPGRRACEPRSLRQSVGAGLHAYQQRTGSGCSGQLGRTGSRKQHTGSKSQQQSCPRRLPAPLPL